MFELPQGFFGLFPQAGAPGQAPYTAQDIANARWDLIGNLGMQMMAMGQPGLTGPMKAQMLSNMGNLGDRYKQNLRSGLEDRELQYKIEERDRLRNAPAPTWMSPEQAQEWGNMDLDTRRDVQGEYYKSQFAAPGAPHVVTLVSPRSGETASLDMSDPTHRTAAMKLMDKGWTERQGQPLVQVGDKLNEQQSRVIQLWPNIVQANQALETLDTQLTSPSGQLSQYAGDWARYMQSDEYQLADRAATDFVANLLYIKSGATARPDEIEAQKKVLFPQPGEERNPSIIAAKRAARQAALDGLRMGLGAAAQKVEGYQPPQPQPIQKQPKAGDTVDDPAQVPEGATVTDTQTGKRYKKVNGQLVPVQ